jgi:membrane-associated protease RseP (regulator of RpoE activity)
MGLAVGAWMGSLMLTSAWAQESATSGVTPPDGGVRRVDDPLRQRSATENTVFGQIVSSDDHRLTIIEGEGDAVVESEFIYGPGIKVFIDERPARLQDIPADARIKVFRDPDDPTIVTDVVVLPDEPGAPADEPAVPEEPALVDSTSPVGFGLVLEGTPEGLMVVSVRADGPADKAGIEAGDEIVALDEEPVGLPADILAATAGMEDGATVTMTIRRDGTERNVSLIAEKGPAGKDTVRTAATDAQPTVVVEDDAPEVSNVVTPEVDLGATLATDTDGIAVVRVGRGSPLAKAGVKEGDLIQKAAGKSVLTPESLFRVLNELDGGAQVELDVLRDEQELSLTLELPADHKRVLVDNEVSTAGAANPDHQRVGYGDRTGRTASVEELQQIVARQQEQIDWLYNALMDVSSATGVATNGWGAFPGSFPFGFSGVAAGDGGTDVNGDGFIDQDVNGDGLIDVDTNGDGIIDEDSDGDGVIDDVNGDGVLDRDIDGDGIRDVDVNGDGVIDPSGQTPPDTTPLERRPGRETGVDLPPGEPQEPAELRDRRRDSGTTPDGRPHPGYIGPPVRRPGGTDSGTNGDASGAAPDDRPPGLIGPPVRRPAPTTSNPNVPGATQPVAPAPGAGAAPPATGGNAGTP